MARRLLTAAVAAAAIAAAAALSGCGATHAISSEVDPVARAATVTSHAAGYRMAATIDVSTAAAAVHGTLAGAVDTTHHTGDFTLHEVVAGHAFALEERLAGTTAYMSFPGQPAIQRLTGGKKWVKLDFGRALGALGFGGLPTQGTDPTQFLDYLRTVGAKTTKVGTATIDGAQTTHYHVVVNLDNYPKLFPPSRRAAAAHGVATMESVMGRHTLPMDAWIDSRSMLRRMSFSFGECVQSQHLSMTMAMNLSGYGPQTVSPAPSASDAYDLTPLIEKSVQNLKPGTCSPTA